MVTIKHFVAIAKALSDSAPAFHTNHSGACAYDKLVSEIADVLEASNCGLDRGGFIAACY